MSSQIQEILLVEMADKNQIGTGGFGMVYTQLFHGIPVAMKCVWTDEMDESGGSVQNAVSYLNKNISEIRLQTAIIGSGVIVPIAFIRQQDQEQDENGNWIANNYNIFIYPLYDCNLYELHQTFHEEFNTEIINGILNQYLTRKNSNL